MPNLCSFHIGSNYKEPIDFSSRRKIVTLRLPVYCLLACLTTQVLPRTLERLDVEVVSWVDRRHLTRLMVEYIKRKPAKGDAWALKFISIDSKVGYCSGFELDDVCRKKGVKLEYKVEQQVGHVGREAWGY
ncbi:hypothetical protein ACJ73_07774 [Blastomyces percursus]|uniref:Uncharacterized protein n=1 Tax=Blastomyces percursus TaxID=1658174 RepID=A0A1J9QYH2_9EURO|nr:hypothetical protein ACJ73_07774 [Blastomyces percursus]